MDVVYVMYVNFELASEKKEKTTHDSVVCEISY